MSISTLYIHLVKMPAEMQLKEAIARTVSYLIVGVRRDVGMGRTEAMFIENSGLVGCVKIEPRRRGPVGGYAVVGRIKYCFCMVELIFASFG
jgi:hypothetical protein